MSPSYLQCCSCNPAWNTPQLTTYAVKCWPRLCLSKVKQAPPTPYSRIRDGLNSGVSLCGGIIGVCSCGVGRRRLPRRFSHTPSVQQPFIRPSSPKPSGSHKSIASSCLPSDGPRLPSEVPREGKDGGHNRITAGNDDAPSRCRTRSGLGWRGCTGSSLGWWGCPADVVIPGTSMLNVAFGLGTGEPAGSGLGFGASAAASSLSLLEPKDIASEAVARMQPFCNPRSKGLTGMPNGLQGSHPKWLGKIAGWNHYQPTSPKFPHPTQQTQSPGNCNIVPSKTFNSKCNSRRFWQHAAMKENQRKAKPERRPGTEVGKSILYHRAHGGKTVALQSHHRVKPRPASERMSQSSPGQAVDRSEAIHSSKHSSNLSPPTHPQLGVRCYLVLELWSSSLLPGPLAAYHQWRTSGSMSSLSKNVTTMFHTARQKGQRCTRGASRGPRTRRRGT